MGRHVVRLLADAGHEIDVLVRSRPLGDSLAGRIRATHRVDALVPTSLDGVFSGVEVVFSCVGASLSSSLRGWSSYGNVDVPANANLIEAAVGAKVRRFVYVSLARADSFPPIDYVSAHERVVEVLRAADIDGAVVRPAGFFSAFEEYLTLARRGFVPVFGDGSARTNPISDLDVARACVELIEGSKSELECGGPETLTREEIVTLAIEAVGRGRVVKMPAWSGRLGAVLATPFHPRLAALARFLVEVGTRDLVADAYGTDRLDPHFRARASQLDGA